MIPDVSLILLQVHAICLESSPACLVGVLTTQYTVYPHMRVVYPVYPKHACFSVDHILIVVMHATILSKFHTNMNRLTADYKTAEQHTT